MGANLGLLCNIAQVVINYMSTNVLMGSEEGISMTTTQVQTIHWTGNSGKNINIGYILSDGNLKAVPEIMLSRKKQKMGRLCPFTLARRAT